MIIHGTAYIDGELKNTYIGIKKGKIDFVKKHYTGDEEVEEIDEVILPGGTDLHVHFRDPGHTKKEDFFSGSKSAAFGGITTVADMPNNHPPIKTLDNFERKLEIAKEKSCVDFALYSLIGDDVEDIAERTGLFKIYLSSSTNTDKNVRVDGIRTVFEKGGKIAFHCEDEEYFSSPSEDLPGYNRFRPAESEVNAIRSLSELPEGPKRVCHVSTKEGLEEAKSQDLTVEVTPHHLFLNEEAFLGGFGKVNPPLRKQDDQIALWESYERGGIDFVASDHAPHLENEKSDFVDAPPGIPGVETMYPLLLNSVSMGTISLSTVIETIAEKPGEYLDVKKGKIKEGYYADFIMVDFRRIESIKRENLHSKAGWSPFEGFNAVFPIHVMSRGEYLIKDNNFTGEKGRGKFISARSSI
ncbi:MAG: dihydroorotase [Candidatus Saliniplasma sp.]